MYELGVVYRNIQRTPAHLADQLAHFGSAKAVGRAAVDDLKAVDGISDTLAQGIYDFFHARG
jgi:excinuclease UvrABC nuclease subunit